ncbi:hypothetical protein QR98_0040260, partial [Sarcoptes scabiei]
SSNDRHFQSKLLLLQSNTNSIRSIKTIIITITITITNSIINTIIANKREFTDRLYLYLLVFGSKIEALKNYD